MGRGVTTRGTGPDERRCRRRGLPPAVPYEGMTGIGRLSLAALDCADPRSLAAFYAAITGWPVDEDDADDTWVQLRSGAGPTLAFQRVPDHRPPVWPGSEHPQQLHLDFDVADLDVAEAQVVALTARRGCAAAVSTGAPSRRRIPGSTRTGPAPVGRR